jgi:hypothetical protein
LWASFHSTKTQSVVEVIEKEIGTDKDSQVELISDTQNLRDIEAKRLAIPPLLNPYPNGIKLISAREADEEAKYGEVLRWSSDSDVEESKDRQENMTKASDKTPSPPDFLNPQKQYSPEYQAQQLKTEWRVLKLSRKGYRRLQQTYYSKA